MAAPTLSPADIDRWSRIGALSALAMLLGYLECFIPIPIPGVKLGLANIAVLVAFASHDLAGAFFVGLVKVLATGLLFGNPVTFAYSITGTLLAFACMAPLSLLPTMRLWMVSVVGALAHEAGQLLVAQILLGTPLVWYSAPPLAVAGCITGLLCGMAAERTAALLDIDAPLRPAPGGTSSVGVAPTGQRSQDGLPKAEGAWRAALMMGAYLVFVAATMHARTWLALSACLAATVVACAAAQLRPKTLGAALAPTLPIALITLVAQVASAQQGTPLVTLGPVVLTHEALAETAIMLVRLSCITSTSVAVVHLAGRDGLAAGTQLMLRPLKRLGLNTMGPELAFATALQLVASLADSLPHKTYRRAFFTHSFWTKDLPALARDLYKQACQGR